jgi:hypothetical protein
MCSYDSTLLGQGRESFNQPEVCCVDVTAKGSRFRVEATGLRTTEQAQTLHCIVFHSAT